MKSIFISLIFLFTISFYTQAQSNEVFKVPKKVVKKSDFFTSFLLRGDTNEARIYFYFEGGVMDTIAIQKDTVLLMSEIDEYIPDTGIVILYGLQTTNSKTWLVGNDGELLFPKAFDQINFATSPIITQEEMDPFSGNIIFYGYGPVYEDYWEYVSFDFSYPKKPSVENYTINFDKYFPFFVRIKDKWGLLDRDGNLIAPIEYTKIVRGDRGYELYKGNVIDGIINYAE